MYKPKEVTFGKAGLQRIYEGSRKVARAVGSTIGSRGRNVVLPNGSIINDGVSIAREIQFSDPYENLGAQLMVQAASKTNEKAGDGTTTSVVLAHAIFKEGLKYITAGYSPLFVKRGIDLAVKHVVTELKKIAKPVTTLQDKINVATISANDAAIGKVIGEAVHEVGEDGVVAVESWQGYTLEKEIMKGVQFENGLAAPYFITNPNTLACEYENALVLLTTYAIEKQEDLIPAMDYARAQEKPLVIIAADITGQALSMLVTNKMRGTVKCVGIKAPRYGDEREEMMADLAALVGGVCIAEKAGYSIKDFEPKMLGQVKKITSDKHTTTIIEGAAKKGRVAERIAEVKTLLKDQRVQYQKEFLRQRLGKLTGKVAIIKVGAPTEMEINDKRLRIEDAVNATRSAVEEGILPGGGAALFHVSSKLSVPSKEVENEDMQIGVDIILNVIQAPIKKIIRNAGSSVDLILAQLKAATTQFGFNSETQEVEDLIKSGVIDPLKVTRSGLEHAASVSGMILTSDTVIVDSHENKAIDAVKALAQQINPEANI